MVDLLIRGGEVVTPGGIGRFAVAIAGEQIVAVAGPGVVREAERVIDASGKIVIPGGVDPHCHWNLGWRETKCEGQEHSWAAAGGGTRAN